MHRTLTAVALTLPLASCASTRTTGAPPPDHPLVDRVLALREASRAEDYDLARTYVADDCRSWWGQREGEGSPWQPGAGRWHDWDEHFNASSTNLAWGVGEDSVWTNVHEINDYYRLLDRPGSWYRQTWFFDSDGLVNGVLIGSYENAPAREPGRLEEFEAWAKANAPEEWAYLHPGADIDPTGDRPARMRALLERWRREAGLAPID